MGMLNNMFNRSRPLHMAGANWHSTLFCPTAIAIHDNSQMMWKSRGH
jgi:hypothetical protein